MLTQSFKDQVRQVYADSGLSRVFRFVMEHLGQATAAGYAYMTAAGIIRGIWFYHVSGINPFLYFSALDYVLVGARHPVGLLFPIFIVPCTVVYAFIGALLQVSSIYMLGRAKWISSRVDPSQLMLRPHYARMIRATDWLICAMGVFLTLIIFVVSPQQALINPDKLTCSPVMHITLKAEGDAKGKEITTDQRILDSAEKMLFVKDPRSGNYGVLALESIVSIRPAASAAQGTTVACLLYQ